MLFFNFSCYFIFINLKELEDKKEMVGRWMKGLKNGLEDEWKDWKMNEMIRKWMKGLEDEWKDWKMIRRWMKGLDDEWNDQKMNERIRKIMKGLEQERKV